MAGKESNMPPDSMLQCQYFDIMDYITHTMEMPIPCLFSLL